MGGKAIGRTKLRVPIFNNTTSTSLVEMYTKL